LLSKIERERNIMQSNKEQNKLAVKTQFEVTVVVNQHYK